MKKCVSLFSCAGLGDVGLEKAGIETISACEIIKERADLMQHNFPNTRIFNGDIWLLQDEIINHAEENLKGETLFMMIISAPCQGASSNGIGCIKNQIRKGKRERDDPRNRLILPAIAIIKRLRPKFLLIENVPGMRFTSILNEYDQYETIFSILHRQLREFVLRSTILNTAHYGVPQSRRRLITLGIYNTFTDESRIPDFYDENLSFLHPPATHGVDQPLVTLSTCLSKMPFLDAKTKLQDERDALHRIPKWNDMQYFCMAHTPPGGTAFDNVKCVHCDGDTLDKTQIHCQHCHHVMPRPYVELKDGTKRLIKAFKTSYKRMNWDVPGNALTTNSGVISSDVKGHPCENRVLSLREILILAGIGRYPGNDILFEYDFNTGCDRLIRHVIGECIPPLLSFRIATHFQTFV